MSTSCGCTFTHDPGPCPVDDAPHTTCTSPDYVPTLKAEAIQRTLPPGSFTTGTYRRGATSSSPPPTRSPRQ